MNISARIAGSITDAATQEFGVGPEWVTAIDNWIEKVATGWQESEQTVFRARVCVSELAANDLEHGGPEASNGHIVVTLRHVGDGIEVIFMDSLRPFDPTANRTATKFPPSEIGGFGLLLIRAFADEFSYSNDGTHNLVKLKILSI
jgi:anti-sigma regulatory factor (Ser/Thr protein kinase)